MPKESPQQRITFLEKQVLKLRRSLRLERIKLGVAGPKVSPFAPEGGFPDLLPVAGVRWAAAAAGVKYADRDDVMLAEMAAGTAVAGVFTTSKTRAAPVLDCEAKLAALAGKATAEPVALLVNSGNANAFTGAAGDGSVQAICQATADVVGTKPAYVFTASTGVIGEPLPHDRIISTLSTLHLGLGLNGAAAASAIMTTDTFPKGATVEIELDGKPVRISGFAKGSGMIAPNMATMLVYIFTDAAIRPELLQKLLSNHCDTTFNCITVDGDTSTSDALMVFATGQAGNKEIASTRSKAGAAFSEALHGIMLDLAHQVVGDGEGAKKFIEVSVTGAENDKAAHTIGMAIANSPLVKTAFAGEDPNWGRIVMAVGKSGEAANRDKLTVRFGDILVAEKGWVAESYTEQQGADYMTQARLRVGVDVGIGTGAATVWTCDLTHSYVTINADYRS